MKSRMAALAVAVLTAGCGGAGDAPSGDTVPADTIVAQPLALIGELLDGPPEYLFGDVTSVAADSRGTVYVADGIGSTVRAYDTSSP